MSRTPPRQRRRLTLKALLGVVALSAGLLAWLRPISQGEAIRIATSELLRASAGAGVRVAGYRPHARLTDSGDGRTVWIVNFVDPPNGEPRAQVSLYRWGNVASVILSPPPAPSPGSGP